MMEKTAPVGLEVVAWLLHRRWEAVNRARGYLLFSASENLWKAGTPDRWSLRPAQDGARAEGKAVGPVERVTERSPFYVPPVAMRILKLCTTGASRKAMEYSLGNSRTKKQAAGIAAFNIMIREPRERMLSRLHDFIELGIDEQVLRFTQQADCMAVRGSEPPWRQSDRNVPRGEQVRCARPAIMSHNVV